MSNPTLLVSPFNESLALTDANGAGTWTGVEPIRFDDGLWVEEGTTNLVTNPSFEVNTTGWVVALPNRTASRVTSHARSGSASLQVTHTAGTGSQGAVSGIQNITLTAVAHTWSCYVYIPSSWTGGTIVLTTAGFVSASLPAVTEANMAITDQWQRLEYTFTPDAGDLVGDVYVSATSWTINESVYIDCAQVEAKAYATSYCDGSLGDGYAWTGTAHASTSTRAASSASVDPTDRIDPASGAIAFRYKRLIDTGGEEVILTCGSVGSGTDYLEIGVDANDDLYMEWNSDNAGAQRVTSTFGNIATNTEYLFYADWDGTTIRLSVDNGALDSDTRDAVEGDWGAGDLELVA